MKKIFALTFVAFVAALICCGAYAADKKPEKNTAEVTFVTTIDCKNCVKKVEAQLPFVAGVKDMKVTLDDKTGQVTAVKAGKVKVTVSTYNGKKATVTIKITK